MLEPLDRHAPILASCLGLRCLMDRPRPSDVRFHEKGLQVECGERFAGLAMGLTGSAASLEPFWLRTTALHESGHSDAGRKLAFCGSHWLQNCQVSPFSLAACKMDLAFCAASRGVFLAIAVNSLVAFCKYIRPVLVSLSLVPEEAAASFNSMDTRQPNHIAQQQISQQRRKQTKSEMASFHTSIS